MSGFIRFRRSRRASTSSVYMQVKFLNKLNTYKRKSVAVINHKRKKLIFITNTEGIITQKRKIVGLQAKHQ